MSRKVVTLDLREDIRRGLEPFSKIMKAFAELGPNDDLKLVAPFEPTPLYGVLGSQGLTAQPKLTASGDWEILFTHSADNSESAKRPSDIGARESRPASRTAQEVNVVEVDARGLEPPGPLVRILEALESLPPTACMRALTDRRPMHLYPKLEERGFRGETQEHQDGSFITDIRRRQGK